ncbi:reverse transcriptase domain-containing protein [Tanacetum coccineum]
MVVPLSRVPKGVKNSVKGVRVKVQPPGSASAGAGAILKRLRSSKVMGKGRSHSRPSPDDVFRGKRPISNYVPVDDVLSKVLDRIEYDKSISKQMVFKEGLCDADRSSCNKQVNKGYYLINGNDGSFIKKPDPGLVSNGASKLNMADEKHIGVESTRKAEQDGGYGGKGDLEFVFGNVQSKKGIIKNPTIGLTMVQFGPSLFYKTNNAWSSFNSGIKALNSDGSLNIESFAEKMKKGVEDRELHVIFDPQCVSKNSDGSRRIAISVEDIKKGSEACSLQLYGYFVGTSMDYRVVNANLSRMWRVHGIADITKTSVGFFYFKFKSEEDMKAVLESGPWMVNNIPLVLNVWEPGIWLDKVVPSTILIWVCVYGIPMKLCNGNGIGKIFSGIGKPMLMDKLIKERCLKKSRKIDFARVLVEVFASDDLPNFLSKVFSVAIYRTNLSRMWRVHGIADITKTSVGFFYFKFKSEEDMKAVLESGPWMVNNIPLVLNVWEPGIWLDKVVPSTILIWVCVYGIPMKLCNGNGIGKIFSGIGKPMLMDKLIKERCLKKSRKIDFARVLVEVFASDDLPNFLEIEYPRLGERPARVGKLEVKYQWKPPLCTYCSTFGHATVSCKVRPRTDEKIAEKATKDALKIGEGLSVKDVDRKIDEDGFVTIGRTLVDKSFVKNEAVRRNVVENSKSEGLVQKPPLSLKYNKNFKPKVLVRGSGSNGKLKGIVDENIQMNNSFQALEDHDMVDKEDAINKVVNEEYDKIMWPRLKLEVDKVMESGIYPTLATRTEWSLSQLDYFYNNCSSHGMKPYVNDDDDVESENEGMANVMRHEKSDANGPDVVDGRTIEENVISEC